MVLRNGELLATERLELHLLSVDDIIALLEHPDHRMPAPERPFTNPHRILMDDPGPLPWRVASVRRDPSVNSWLIRFIVLQSSREVIGYVGFHDAPDASGMIEVGITVHPAFRGRGYAREALLELWRWAVGRPGVRTLRYTVSPDNRTSVRIAEGFGLAHVGRQIDEIDGPEDIYEMSAVEFAARLTPLPTLP
jgi:RimJ/RimL family protein N-acetyltransferase